jgi:hypothetical protein
MDAIRAAANRVLY